jgi:hypothetical protein
MIRRETLLFEKYLKKEEVREEGKRRVSWIPFMILNGQYMIVYDGKILPYYPPYGTFWTTARLGFILPTQGHHRV